MNDDFDLRNREHENLIAKLRNSISELKFYALRFDNTLNPDDPLGSLEKRIEKGGRVKVQLLEILEQYLKIKASTPENASQLFYETWIFCHDFDHHLKSIKQ